MSESLSLKWGTIKSWNLKEGGRAIAELGKYYDAGPVTWSAMAQKDTPEQKQCLCDLIDCLEAETVLLDWEGKEVSKTEAKDYIMGYRTKKVLG